MNDGWGRARRVLCLRLDQLGDLVMTTPALRALRSLPGGPSLTLLASPAGVACADRIPVDAAIAWRAPWMKATPAPDPAADLALIERLRAGRFDAAVIFTVRTQSALPAALLCLLAGIPLRLAHARENPYHLLTDWVPDREPDAGAERHEVRRQLDLVAAVGAHTKDEHLVLRVGDDERRGVAARLAAAGVDLGRPWVALHPGATAPSRRYPPPLFAEAAAQLAARGWQIVLLGGDAERESVAEIARAVPGACDALVGATTLGELAAAIALAPVLVANNSAPAHLAAAVGTPVVDLYALTNPQHTPWRVASRVLSHAVPCRGCAKSVCPEGHHLCLRGVAPRRVADAVQELAARA